MARTQNETIREITETYLEKIDRKNPPKPAVIEAELLEEMEIAFEAINTTKEKGRRWSYLQKLIPSQIADILLRIHRIANITYAGEDAEKEYDAPSIYQSEGENEGIYVSGEHEFFLLAQKYNYSIAGKDVQEIINIIRHKAPRKTRCDDKNLVAVNNGIFDYETKQLMPFSPDFIFTAKSKVNYNDQAYNVVIHNPDDNTDWDVEGWMDDLSDDPEIVHVLWQILGAIIRPNVPWNKAAWFYSNTGNNGKGTLCELMRQLCGKGTYASIPLSDFSKDFMLEPLISATAIIVDENDVGTYIDKAANLKAVVTGDVIQINRKFKKPVAYRFKGFMAQCLNEIVKGKDKSDSFYRRQLFIPFTKCFTGKERKYIKNDYLQRPEVLEYVMYKVLNMDYYELDTPQACKDALEEYKECNDPVRQFFNEVVLQASWDLLPFGLLYDLYKSWFKKNNPSGSIQSKTSFIDDIIVIANQSSEWICGGRNYKMRIRGRMSCCEPLLEEYDLKNWQNPTKQFSGNSMEERCTPKADQFPEIQRGISRVHAKNSADIPQETVTD